MQHVHDKWYKMILLANSKVITDQIISENIESSNFYSIIIIVEANDIGHCEQMSVCCRYFHDSKVK